MDLLDPMAEIAQLLGLVAEDAGNVAGPYDPVGAGIPVVQNLSAGANGGFIASLPLGEFLVGLPALGNVARDSANDRRSAVGVEADPALVRDPGDGIVGRAQPAVFGIDRKSTRLNSSH